MVPVLAQTLERWHKFANREMAIVVKLTVFQVLNTCVPATFFVWYNGGSTAGDWYPTGGSLVLTALIGDLIVVNVSARPGPMC